MIEHDTGSRTTATHDPDQVARNLIDVSNRIDELPNAGLTQGMAMIAAAGFSIAAAVRDLAKAVRERDAA